jgi:hypothetical protein
MGQRPMATTLTRELAICSHASLRHSGLRSPLPNKPRTCSSRYLEPSFLRARVQNLTGLERFRRAKDFAQDDGFANGGGVAQALKEGSGWVGLTGRYRTGDGWGRGRPEGCGRDARCYGYGSRRWCASLRHWESGGGDAADRPGGGDWRNAEETTGCTRQEDGGRFDRLEGRGIYCGLGPDGGRNGGIDGQADGFHETSLALGVGFSGTGGWARGRGRGRPVGGIPVRFRERSGDGDDQDEDRE